MGRGFAVCPGFGLLLALGSSLMGCATHYSWQATVPLPGPVATLCLEAALDAEHDLGNLTRTTEGGLAFVWRPESDPEQKHPPAFSLHSTEAPPTLQLSTRYEKGLFHDPSEQVARARALAIAVTLACTGHNPQLGREHPCGKGEPHDLCVVADRPGK